MSEREAIERDGVGCARGKVEGYGLASSHPVC